MSALKETMLTILLFEHSSCPLFYMILIPVSPPICSGESRTYIGPICSVEEEFWHIVCLSC